LIELTRIAHHAESTVRRVLLESIRNERREQLASSEVGHVHPHPFESFLILDMHPLEREKDSGCLFPVAAGNEEESDLERLWHRKSRMRSVEDR
jgi:hypothetical protein